VAGVIPAGREPTLVGVRQLRGNASPLQPKRATEADKPPADDQS
jgi:hypothetical protein